LKSLTKPRTVPALGAILGNDGNLGIAFFITLIERCCAPTSKIVGCA
jgi:hypothetical protein